MIWNHKNVTEILSDAVVSVGKKPSLESVAVAFQGLSNSHLSLDTCQYFFILFCID